MKSDVGANSPNAGVQIDRADSNGVPRPRVNLEELRATLQLLAGDQQHLDFSPQLMEELRDVARAMSDFNANMESVSARLSPILKDIAAFRSIVGNFGAQYADALKKAQQLWSGLLRWYKTEARQAPMALAKHGWFLSPSMPLRVAVKATEIAFDATADDLSKFFTDYVASNGWRNADDMTASWERSGPLRHRAHILRACVVTLRLTPAEVGPLAVLPTLIAQIDGALTELAQTMGLSRTQKGQHWVDEARTHRQRERWLAERLKDPFFAEPAMDVVLNVLFEKATPGKPVVSPLAFNRHKILHGECTDYGRLENVVRALLVLDFLAGVDLPTGPCSP